MFQENEKSTDIFSEINMSDDFKSRVLADFKLNNPLLKEMAVLLPSNNEPNTTLIKNIFEFIPVFIYVLGEDAFHEKNLHELKELKETCSDQPILFLPATSKITISRETINLQQQGENNSEIFTDNNQQLWEGSKKRLDLLQLQNLQNLADNSDQSNVLINFINNILKEHVLEGTLSLCEVHNNSLRKLISNAFDLSREIDITPKRLKYVRETESKLYANLLRLISDKEKDLALLIASIIQNMMNEIQNAFFNKSDVEKLAIKLLTTKVVQTFLNSVNVFHESVIGTLLRCLRKLEEYSEINENHSASDALQRFISIGYNIDVYDLSSTFLNSTSDKPNQETIFSDTLLSIDPSKFACTIALEFKKKVHIYHHKFKVIIKTFCFIFN